MIIVIKHKHGIELLILSAAGELLYNTVVLPMQVEKLIEGSQDVTADVPAEILSHIKLDQYAAGYKIYVYDMRVSEAKKKSK